MARTTPISCKREHVEVCYEELHRFIQNLEGDVKKTPSGNIQEEFYRSEGRQGFAEDLLNELKGFLPAELFEDCA